MPILPLSLSNSQTTVADIIRGALRLLGAIATGEQPEPSELADGLRALNGMLDGWNTESLTVFGLNRQVFALQPGKQTYTLGPGGDFDTYRPERIDQGWIRLTDQTQPADLAMMQLDDEEWGDIIVKGIQSSIPGYFWNDRSFPLANISVWPIPALNYSLVLNMASQLSRFTSTTDQIALPPGYERALRYSLAVELAPEYEKQPSAALVAVAVTAKADIKRANIVPLELKCDDALLHPRGSVWNRFTGGFGR